MNIFKTKEIENIYSNRKEIIKNGLLQDCEHRNSFLTYYLSTSTKINVTGQW